jgi:hypothetical protein
MARNGSCAYRVAATFLASEVPTLDIWSNSASWRLRGLVQSAFACLLTARQSDRPVYLCSPWISDFPVFDNAFGQFAALVPIGADRPRLYLSDCLAQLSDYGEVRIVSKRNGTSEAFYRIPALQKSRIKMQMADDKLHEKGFLTPLFYLEGSMNITYSGVMINSEKVIYHSGNENSIRAKINNAYLEFDRRWELLQS